MTRPVAFILLRTSKQHGVYYYGNPLNNKRVSEGEADRREERQRARGRDG